MKLSITDHRENGSPVEVNKDKVMAWTYRKRKALLEIIDLTLDPLIRIAGILYICTGLGLLYSMIAYRLSPLIEFFMGFSIPVLLVYGWDTYKRKFMVNRKQFVDSVTHEIEQEMKEKINHMENEAFMNITQKLTDLGLTGLEGMELGVKEFNPETGETRIAKTVKVKKEKKPTMN